MGFFGNGETTTTLGSDELHEKLIAKSDERQAALREREEAQQDAARARKNVRRQKAKEEAGLPADVDAAESQASEAEARVAELDERLTVLNDACDLIREERDAARNEELKEQRAEIMADVKRLRRELADALVGVVDLNESLTDAEERAIEMSAMRESQTTFWRTLQPDRHRGPKPPHMAEAFLQQARERTGYNIRRERYKHLGEYLERIEES